jgi:hypothetical protein
MSVHCSDLDEMKVMSDIDFVVPLKQVGLITRSVLEAIHTFYKPRKIIVVTKKSEGELLRSLLKYWNVGIVECLDEEIFFVRNFGLSFDDIIAEYDAKRPGENLYICIYMNTCMLIYVHPY